MKIKILKRELPFNKMSMGASGFDLCAAEDKTLIPNVPTKVSTGLYIAIPEGYEAQVRSRSGLSLENIVVANSPGTIDSDYRGEVCVILLKRSSGIRNIFKGDRIAQLVFNKVERPEFEYVDHLDETIRGANGFGSTGV